MGLGPTTLALLSTDQHYGDVKALAFAIADAYNAEFKDLAARGLEQVQFAEPLTQFAGLMELESWMVDVLNRCFDGVDMYRVVHLCYGHEQGQPSFAPDWVSADKVFPFAFDIECEQFHIEMASHDFSEVEALRGWPKDRDLAVGVIDGRTCAPRSPSGSRAGCAARWRSCPPSSWAFPPTARCRRCGGSSPARSSRTW